MAFLHASYFLILFVVEDGRGKNKCYKDSESQHIIISRVIKGKQNRENLILETYNKLLCCSCDF